MKRNLIKTFTLVIVIGFTVIMVFSISTADTAPPKQDAIAQDQRPGGQMTNELKAAVISILSNYDPSTLTIDDAKAINRAFREAGIRRGAGQKEAIEAAGFDPETIRALDPPPDRKMKKEKKSTVKELRQ